MVVLVPIVMLLIPGLRLVPSLYRWRIRSRLYRCYGALLALERDILAHSTSDEREALLARLRDIEAAADIIKVPLSFADEFYVLRGHISFVSDRLMNSTLSSRGAPVTAREPER